MFKELETARMMSILAHVPFSDAQILDKALTKIQVTNQYRNALLDWALSVAEDANNNNWNAFKDHFIQAYTANQAALTLTHGGYHGAANTTDDYPNNNSLESIQASLASLEMANNALAQATNDQLSNLTASTQQQISQLAQQMAMLANSQQMQMMPNPMPTPNYNMPPIHHQAQMAQQPHMPPNILAYIPSPQHMQPNNHTNEMQDEAGETSVEENAMHHRRIRPLATTLRMAPSHHQTIKRQHHMVNHHERHTPTPPNILRIGTTAIGVDLTSKNGTRASRACNPNQDINRNAIARISKATKRPDIALPQKHSTNRVFRQTPDD
jgi:hypothetical protein